MLSPASIRMRVFPVARRAAFPELPLARTQNLTTVYSLQFTVRSSQPSVSEGKPGRAAIAGGAFPIMDVGTIGALTAAAALPLEFVDVLKMVDAACARPSHYDLSGAIGKTGFCSAFTSCHGMIVSSRNGAL
jgi:hypothetical protein